MEPEQSDRRIVTLKDVARNAGVSISTASRVLDERLGTSQSDTARRVRAAADELGYRRNVSAASLRRGATSTIGVLVPRLTDAVMALAFEAVERSARRHGSFAVVATCGDDPDEERRATEILLDRNVDGLILATARIDDALPASLRARTIPHVLMLRTDEVSPSSLGDDETGGYLAARHLLDLGHRRIAVLTGPDFTSSGRDRLRGAQRALAEAGVPLPSHHAVHTGYGVEAGAAAGYRLLAADDAPTAVFAANDNLAIGVIASARNLGLTPGRDVSLVGYNDIPLAAQLPTPLTSVATPFDQIATTALDLLRDRDVAPGTMRRALPTLIPRASTGSVPDRAPRA